MNAVVVVVGVKNPAVGRLENVLKRRREIQGILKWLLLLLLLLLLYKKRTMTGLGEGLYIFPVSFSFINTGIAVFFYKAPPDG
jgi:hypothetical protein